MPARRTGAVLAVAGLAAALLLTACAPTGAETVRVTPKTVVNNPALKTLPDIPVVSDLPYADDGGGQRQLLDACLPSSTTDDADRDVPRPAIVIVHGGSWARGDKADIGYRAICQWLASAGYPSFDIDYRLAPQNPYPAAIQDVRAAVRWLRQPAQVKRFDIDPDRIGAFGGSAGGNLVSLLGTEGSGGWTSGSRVAAVAELSGPSDLTGKDATDDFIVQQLAYLGCPQEQGCAAARAASPIFDVDPTDPPFFVAHSTDERIPYAQSSRFVRALRNAGVDTTFVTVQGRNHSISMIDDDLKQRIVAFYQRVLGAKPIGVLP
ncbi:MAG TPA: alpha/beta hydrolase [Pseudolysinimonas sp.]|nr:alpha/beta hydrolase [Pseudolysinimonas sp.]